ncbi:HNH endonuclease signature motif containing protein [Nocardioides sp. P86]|uniref:HNH endonuclease signature motif containing protein n=1 Tax=Nocardioides sp. P86 TaxID=2939569 RepID=UPI00203EAFF0|nr:HNH endonuclease signature motif containing protein [Nocardioides sp. P86]MCM3516162.1 HNH endonuclease [Nocardioides sp. P86]
MLLDLDTTGAVVDVESLEADDVLEYAADTARSVRAAERRTLRVMARWGALNPDRAYAWSVPGMIRHGLDEFAAEPLALALDISPVNAGCNLAEVMELVHRLPRVWAMVEDLTLPGWRARRIASQTQVLNDTGAAYVDRKVAALGPRAQSLGARRIELFVAEAAAKHDPHAQAALEERARGGWNVRVTHDVDRGSASGTSWLEVLGDTQDLTRFHDLICATAAELGRHQTSTGAVVESLEVRKARAIGVITDRAQGLTALDSVEPTTAKERVVYVHLRPEDLAHADTIAARDATRMSGEGPALEEPPPPTEAPADQPPPDPRDLPTPGSEDDSEPPAAAPAGPAATPMAEERTQRASRRQAAGNDHETNAGQAPAPVAEERAQRASRSHPTPGEQPAGDPYRTTGPDLRPTAVHRHYETSHLSQIDRTGPPPGTAVVEGLGVVSTTTLRRWLTHAKVFVRPVIDLDPTTAGAVDRHDPPPWMRDHVTIRDPRCVFPGCTVPSRRCDLDHITPYRPLDHGGRPGQTHPSNLAPLCRHHHRLKTTGSDGSRPWTYHRHPDGTYAWTNPHGWTTLVRAG